MDILTTLTSVHPLFSRNASFILDLLTSLKIPSENHILDIGTGRGNMAIFLALLGHDVITGEPKEDKWADWLSLAKKAKVEKKITFQPFRAEKLPFESNSFSHIFLLGAFHHIPLKEEALAEMFRVLTTEGVCTIFEYTPAGIDLIRNVHPGHSAAEDPRDYLASIPFIHRTVESATLNAYIFTKSH